MRTLPLPAVPVIPAALILAALGGCGTLDAYRARTQLVGAAEPDIIACMGVPAERQYISPQQSVMQWDYVQTGTDLDLAFGLYELKLGRPGICRTAIRFDRGRVRSVHYVGINVTPTDPDSICGRLVHDCLHHRENTPLPGDFSSNAMLTGPAKGGP